MGRKSEGSGNKGRKPFQERSVYLGQMLLMHQIPRRLKINHRILGMGVIGEFHKNSSSGIVEMKA